MELIFTFSFLEILRFLLVVEIYIEKSEISNFCINFTNDSISNVHTCVKVYTSCQFGAFFTECALHAFTYPPYWN